MRVEATVSYSRDNSSSARSVSISDTRAAPFLADRTIQIPDLVRPVREIRRNRATRFPDKTPSNSWIDDR